MPAAGPVPHRELADGTVRDVMAAFFDLDEFGDPHTVSARHRALVLVDEALGSDPGFSWRADGPCGSLASWNGEDGSHYFGRFAQDGAVLWGADADASGPASLDDSAVPERHRVVIDSSPGPPPSFCAWWDGERWSAAVPRPDAIERVIGPLLSDEAAAAWVERHHGLPELVEPLRDFLAVVAAGIPMTPHALVAFTDSVDELNALMRRAAELGLEAAP